MQLMLTIYLLTAFLWLLLKAYLLPMARYALAGQKEYLRYALKTYAATGICAIIYVLDRKPTPRHSC